MSSEIIYCSHNNKNVFIETTGEYWIPMYTVEAFPSKKH